MAVSAFSKFLKQKMKPVILPIVVHTEYTKTQNNLVLPFDLKETDKTMIYASGFEFICTLDVETVHEIITKATK